MDILLKLTISRIAWKKAKRKSKLVFVSELLQCSRLSDRILPMKQNWLLMKFLNSVNFAFSKVLRVKDAQNAAVKAESIVNWPWSSITKRNTYFVNSPKKFNCQKPFLNLCHYIGSHTEFSGALTWEGCKYFRLMLP